MAQSSGVVILGTPVEFGKHIPGKLWWEFFRHLEEIFVVVVAEKCKIVVATDDGGNVEDFNSIQRNN